MATHAIEFCNSQIANIKRHEEGSECNIFFSHSSSVLRSLTWRETWGDCSLMDSKSNSKTGWHWDTPHTFPIHIFSLSSIPTPLQTPKTLSSSKLSPSSNYSTLHFPNVIKWLQPRMGFRGRVYATLLVITLTKWSFQINP